jgi:hypothetical protein
MYDVKKHLIKVDSNRLYLPVAARLVWFRQEHPDWGIETKPIIMDTEKQYAVFEASVFNAEGRLMAKGTKMEGATGFPAYIEAAETGAIGRALAVCGFGTQFAPDLEEVADGHLVDSPVTTATHGYTSNANGYPSRRSNGYTGGGGSAQRIDTSIQADQVRAEPTVATAGDPTSATGSAGSAESDTPATDHECAVCKRGLTKGQELLSVRKYGIALCPVCQKERRTAEAAA